MEAKESKLLDIFTEGKKYFIPKYQRPYSWTKDNAEQLIEDIFNSFSANEKEYFIGSLICIKNDDGIFEVVDGQQRLTTISLILAQLHNLIDDVNIKNDLMKRIFPYDVYDGEHEEPRLKVRSNELLLYTNYILKGDTKYYPENPTVVESAFLENFVVIEEFLKDKDQIALKKIAQFILKNVLVVFVQTENFASSFRLFNVLNSRGLPLTTADLLKNRLFESAETVGANVETVEHQWAKFEALLGIDKIDKFLTIHAISEKKDRDRVLVKILDAFSDNLANKYQGNPINLLNSLLKSAENYQKIKENDFFDHQTRLNILTLLELKSDEWIPAVLAFRNRLVNDKNLTEQDFGKFISVFLKVYIQSCFRKEIKSQREMMIYTALVSINNDVDFPEVIEKIIAHANDDEFKKNLDEPFYEPKSLQVALVKATLLRIDREMQDSSVIKSYSGNITIEHVLPQRPTHDYWFSRFNQADHQHWVHLLGNLTLLGGTKNAESQNFDFERKKQIYMKSDTRVSFDITKDICNVDDWDMDNLMKRHNDLKNKLVNMWCVC